MNSTRKQISDDHDSEQNNRFIHINSILSTVVDLMQDCQDFNKSHGESPISDAMESSNQLSMLQRGDLIAIVDEQGSRNKNLALSFAMQLAENHKFSVCVFSPEMDRHHIGFQMLNLQGQLSPYRISAGQLDDDEWWRVSKALGVLHDVPLFVDDSKVLTVESIGTAVKQHLSCSIPLGLIVIDAVELVSRSEEGNAHPGVSATVLLQLKLLALELNVPIIVTTGPQLRQSAGNEALTVGLDSKTVLEEVCDLTISIRHSPVGRKTFASACLN